jgi:hypothetical protein
MERIITMVKQEQARLAELERLERGASEGPAAARADIAGPSTCAEDPMPAPDTTP